MAILAVVAFVRAQALTAVTFILTASLAAAGGKAKQFEGLVVATVTRGATTPTHLQFTRQGDLVRIEDSTNKLEAINIVDLDKNKVTIIYPHNTTFVRVDLAKKAAQPGPPPLPPNFPPTPNLAAPQPGAHVGPSISPPADFASPPPMPSRPQLPAQGFSAPGMPNPGLAGPMMPPIPSMPSMSGPTELKKTDKTKKIHGFDCTLYTISDRGETFEIWATDDSALFPFRLIERDIIGRRFGPQMIDETWLELLRNKSLFPVEATLKMEPDGQQRFSFKVDKIDRSSGTGKNTGNAAELFSPPKNYIEVQAPAEPR